MTTAVLPSTRSMGSLWTHCNGHIHNRTHPSLWTTNFKKKTVIMEDYTLQELIQNADDAGAKTVHFYLDKRHHRGKNLLHRDLEDFQGPALISYNDACFKKEDWDGITRMQDSEKVVTRLK